VEPPQRERVQDDLKGVVRGELLFDDLSRYLYSTDASIFESVPLGIVLPRDEEDLQALVRYSGEHQIPLIPRGAGTGLAGESLGTGIVVDLSKHFRSIVEIGSDTVRVQPGVVLRELSQRLAAIGRRFAPDPSHRECTLGGMLATNASGARAFKYGYTRDHVERLRVVLDSGDIAEAGWHARWSIAETPHGRLEDIVSSVITLLQENAELLGSDRPRTRFNRCGYLLHDVLHEEALNLARLLVGSEGTLAIFTEATLRTIPLPGGRALVLLGFQSVEAALRAAQFALPSAPVACELIDRRLLTLARGNAEIAALIPPVTEAVLLVEYEADSQKEATGAAVALADRLHRWERLALLARVAVDSDDIERLWQVREAALPSLYALRGAAQPLAFVEDIGIPTESLAKFLHDAQEVLQKHETTASFLVHAATGQVHIRPFLDLHRREDVARLWPLADDLYTVVLSFGGTISAQHGTGLARTPWVSKQYFRLYPVFKKLKAIFDPRHLFNPGKIVGPAPGLPAWPLRNFEIKLQQLEANTEETPQLHWLPLEMADESHNCNGCGQCRIEAPPQRMCPIFRATHAEAATPRAKANLMRYLLHPDTDARALTSDEVRDVADLCVNCKMCERECPAHINIPKLMLEVKAAHVAQHGLDRTDWVLARTELFARLGSAFAPVANELLGSPIARWLLEKGFGVSRHRRLPGFAQRSFLRRAHRRGWTRKPRSPRPRVAYFVDVFANYNDPEIAEAVVAVLHHNGIEVYVPPGQIGCGMAPLAAGDVETAREAVEHNLHIFAELAREGYPILCSEPTAALMLRHDALDLLDDPDVRLVAAQTIEFTAYLWDLHQQGQLRTDFQPLDFSVGHHLPCHLKALGRPAAGPALLSLIPQLRVHTIDVSCSGMAGTFGLKAANYAVSLDAGRPMLDELSRPRVLFGSTECSTCRLQMEDGSRKRTLHPAQYLALAYGLLPKLRQRLLQPIGPLVLP
jgi:FAD/FMN-containing dehydrogenase/Fe-S oxidoreductase